MNTPTDLRAYATRCNSTAGYYKTFGCKSNSAVQDYVEDVPVLSDAVIRLLDDNQKMRVMLKRCRDAMSCPQGVIANHLTVTAIVAVDALLATTKGDA